MSEPVEIKVGDIIRPRGMPAGTIEFEVTEVGVCDDEGCDLATVTFLDTTVGEVDTAHAEDCTK